MDYYEDYKGMVKLLWLILRKTGPVKISDVERQMINSLKCAIRKEYQEYNRQYVYSAVTDEEEL